MAKLVVTSFEEGQRLREVIARFEDPEPLLEGAGAFMVARMQQAFFEQGRPEGSWPDRQTPNVAGIIRDFAQGRADPKPGRLTDSKPGHDSGRLQAELDFELTGPDEVEAGSNLGYAAGFHEGGPKETDIVTREMQTRMGDWLEGEDIETQEALGWLLHQNLTGKRVTIDVQARPFALLLDEDLDDLAELIVMEVDSGNA